MALTAPSAGAAATRAEYASQVNSICIAYNAELDRVTNLLYEKAFPDSPGDDLPTINPKGFRRLLNAMTAISNASSAEVALVPAAPGDEGLVGSWVANKQQIAATVQELNRTLLRSLKLEGEKQQKLERRQGALLLRYVRLAETDTSLGTQLGTTACLEDTGIGE